MGLLILNSRGINTIGGVKIIRDRLESLGLDEFKYNKIFVVSYPYYEVDEFIINNLVKIIGFEKENIYLFSNGIPEGIIPDFVYVTEGNIFEILKYMRLEGHVDYIRNWYKKKKNAIYIGLSAGAMIAGTDVALASDFDSNYVGLTDYESLGLFDGIVIPHYEPDQLERY